MANQETVLTVENLGVKFEDDNEVLKDLSFFVQKEDVLAIVGPNGSGKSVLFRALMGLIRHSGKINWAEGLKISYVPQKFHIDAELPLSVWEFMKFKTKNRTKIIEVLKAVGLAEHHDEHHHGQHDRALVEHLVDLAQTRSAHEQLQHQSHERARARQHHGPCRKRC